MEMGAIRVQVKNFVNLGGSEYTSAQKLTI